MTIAEAIRKGCDKNQGIKRRKWQAQALAVNTIGEFHKFRGGCYDPNPTALKAMDLAADDWETTMLIPYRVPDVPFK